jgi:hypothetical protein
MKLKVFVTSEELIEMGLDEISLTNHIIETLDGDSKELVGYNVEIIIK